MIGGRLIGDDFYWYSVPPLSEREKREKPLIDSALVVLHMYFANVINIV